MTPSVPKESLQSLSPFQLTQMLWFIKEHLNISWESDDFSKLDDYIEDYIEDYIFTSDGDKHFESSFTALIGFK
jgi:hypothetical protein